MGALGVLEDVRDNVDSSTDVLAEALGVVDGLFTGSVSVEVGTEILDLNLECVLTPTVGTLEGHMLQEVCGTAGLVCLSP